MSSSLGDILYQDPVNRVCGLNRGLVSWWLNLPNRFGGGGLRFRDICGRNHGTLINGPTWVGGDRPGGHGALRTDGSDDFADCGTIAIDSNNWTVAAWVRLIATNGNPKRMIAWAGDGPTMYLAADTNIYIVHSGTVDLTSTGSLVTGEVGHFILTRSGSVACIFKNGVKVGESTSFSATYTANNSFTVGKSNAFGENVNAEFDDVRAYSRGLSTSEVYSLYEDSRRGHPLTLTRIPRRITFVPSGAAFLTGTAGIATVTPSAIQPTATGTNTVTSVTGIASIASSAIQPVATGTGTVTSIPGIAGVTVSSIQPTSSADGNVTVVPGTANITVTSAQNSAAADGTATITAGVASITVSSIDVSASAGGIQATAGVANVSVSSIQPTGTGDGIVTVTSGTASVTTSVVQPSVVGTGTVTATSEIVTVTVSVIDASATSDAVIVSAGIATVTVASIQPSGTGTNTVTVTANSAQVSVTSIQPIADPISVTVIPGATSVTVTATQSIASIEGAVTATLNVAVIVTQASSVSSQGTGTVTVTPNVVSVTITVVDISGQAIGLVLGPYYISANMVYQAGSVQTELFQAGSVAAMAFPDESTT